MGRLKHPSKAAKFIAALGISGTISSGSVKFSSSSDNILSSIIPESHVKYM